jgi:hypothetical protein
LSDRRACREAGKFEDRRCVVDHGVNADQLLGDRPARADRHQRTYLRAPKVAKATFLRCRLFDLLQLLVCLLILAARAAQNFERLVIAPLLDQPARGEGLEVHADRQRQSRQRTQRPSIQRPSIQRQLSAAPFSAQLTM